LKLTDRYYILLQVPAVSYPLLVKLLQVSCYSNPVLLGFVISTGGLLESLKKASTSALVGYLQDSDINTSCRGKTKEYLLSCDLLWVLKHYQKCDHVITPTLKVVKSIHIPDNSIFCALNKNHMYFFLLNKDS
jgi:tubulin-specific chaperone D